MKKTAIFFSIMLFLFIFACKKAPSEASLLDVASLVGSEIDIDKIENMVGVSFKLLKTEAVGYAPLHKFYWICLEKKVSREKVKELADAIIKDTIVKKPRTFHSFMIHFFIEEELVGTLELSNCFARANFLPEEGWVKVGRVPIDDYENYRLTCTFIE